jgi:hypothetical protein
VLLSVLQPEDITDEVKRPDLAASVAKQLVAPNSAGLNLIDVARRFFLAVNLGSLSVRKLIRADFDI